MIDQLDTLKQLNKLIREQRTGSPAKLSQQLGLSERSVYAYIKLMKELGAPIRYSATKQSYYYEQTGEVLIQFMRYDDINFRKILGKLE